MACISKQNVYRSNLGFMMMYSDIVVSFHSCFSFTTLHR